MEMSKDEISAVLRRFNPWWSGAEPPDLPRWRRAAYREVNHWIADPPGGRALLLSGARQIGKTTLFLQTIDDLLKQGVSAANILYATFDHPLLKLSGLESLIRLWRETEPKSEGPEYLFLDEIQLVPGWQVWLKHQVDFERGQRRIAVTGSAMPLATDSRESGVGRWHTVKLATLSFFEHLQIRNVPAPELPPLRSLRMAFDWSEGERARVGEVARPLTGLFHEYLIRGGFPVTTLTEDITRAQRMLREDIVDKVLKRDMTALYGVRNVLELEQLFLYLCLHDGNLLDVTSVSENLGLPRSTVNRFIDLLEASHLIHRLRPYGYGKQVLRGKQKIYIADAAIAPSVLVRGKALLDDPAALGRAVETSFFKHVFTRYYARSIGFTYWQNKKGLEVDIIAESEGDPIPFEVKYRDARRTERADLKGMAAFCESHSVGRGYVVTRDTEDFGVMTFDRLTHPVALLKIPAPLACYWLGQSEVEND